eukprot:TRINITY_DN50433_c0_g1_i1.p1 TRINITY_DN50433_c0_g1~~TRINITY_DN50433_c0_g1_i1.p1  ORF type:complete len:400 (+),score=59.69 TRINITY_DN50433_c0_g1_i1:85-1284(+)
MKEGSGQWRAPEGTLPASWELVGAAQLEKGFDLRTCNVGGAHSEFLENRPENMRRTLQTIIPEYNAFADPHLVRYHRSNRTVHLSPAAEADEVPSRFRLRLRSRQASARRQHAAQLLRRPSLQVSSPRSRVPPRSYICSTEQVLQLKRTFWQHSCEPSHQQPRFIPIAAERTPQPERASPPPASGRVAGIDPGEHNFAFIYCCGVNITNMHRKLRGELPIRPAYMERLWHALHLLDSADNIDWPAFLLLCTVDIGDDAEYAKLLRLKDSFSQYLQSNDVSDERSFAALVVHLNGGTEIADQTYLRSFFQQGDFYRSRGGFNSFPEAIFSLYEFFTQVYIIRARARGGALSHNFTGHGVPGNIGGPGKWQRGRPRSCPPSMLASQPVRKRPARTATTWIP